MTLFWNPESTPPELHPALGALSEEYAIRSSSAAGTELRFEHVPGSPCTIKADNHAATIRYGVRNMAMRAVGSLLAGMVMPGVTYTEHSPFAKFGMMLDCSRNAVMRPDHLRRWLRRLCLFGYNTAMLYTEDTYEIPDESYFGYMRGRYTGAELHELDDYARMLGIELVGCIQTLGHLEQVLRWPAYAGVRDTESVLLVGDDKTYELVGKMLDAVGGYLHSRRIHVGMDEAYGMGRGRFLDKRGFHRRPEVFNQHLRKVVELCRERGLEPMIWSDMYFAMASRTGDAFDPHAEVMPEIAQEIPREVKLVYWDYYHANKEFYQGRIAKHRKMGFEPVVASGVWTWSELWYNRKRTEENAGACIDACREADVAEVLMTLWGDDGAYCDFDSALAGLAFAAERAFAPGGHGLEHRFKAICHTDYEPVTKASELTQPIPTTGILWDDPLLGIFHNEALAGTEFEWPDVAKHLKQVQESLFAFRGENEAGDLGHAALLAEFLHRKVALRLRLGEAYRRGDRAGLAAVASECPQMAALVDDLSQSWRRQWLKRNKPFGLEVLQTRLAGQAARYRELNTRIEEFLAGKQDSIPELKQRPADPSGSVSAAWRNLASGSTIL
jgi:hexosaminidase